MIEVWNRTHVLHGLRRIKNNPTKRDIHIFDIYYQRRNDIMFNLKEKGRLSKKLNRRRAEESISWNTRNGENIE